ncbi:hypothetical protein MY11210_002600 [Beauveria gryllotalpidicola]
MESPAVHDSLQGKPPYFITPTRYLLRAPTSPWNNRLGTAGLLWARVVDQCVIGGRGLSRGLTQM